MFVQVGFDHPRRNQQNWGKDCPDEVECYGREGWVGEQQQVVCRQGPDGKLHLHL